MINFNKQTSKDPDTDFHVNTIEKESKWDLKNKNSQGWNGQITKINRLSTGNMYKYPKGRGTVVEEIKNFKISKSKIAKNQDYTQVRNQNPQINFEDQPKRGVQTIEMENLHKRQIIEEEVQRPGIVDKIRNDNQELNIKTSAIVDSNKIILNLLKNTLDQQIENKIEEAPGDIMKQSLRQENLKLVKKNSQAEKTGNDLFLEKSTLIGNEMVKEVSKKDNVFISKKMEIKKIILDIPKDGCENKFARIEIVDTRKIYLNEEKQTKPEKRGYQMNIVSKINLETSDLKIVDRKSLAKEIFEDLNQDPKEFVNTLSYENLEFKNEKISVNKELIKEEINNEKGEELLIKKDQNVELFNNSYSQRMDSTVQEYKNFFDQNKEFTNQVPESILKSSMKLINLPNQTYKILSKKFNGQSVTKFNYPYNTIILILRGSTVPNKKMLK